MRPEAPPEDAVDFGDLPPGVNSLLQQGVAAHRTDKAAADTLFREALALDPEALPTYYCLYKIHCYGGRLEEAQRIAEAGLETAARQAGLPEDWRDWADLPPMSGGPGRFALYTLKALAFIALRDGRGGDTAAMLTALARLDPDGSIGWPVVADLASAMTT